MRIPLPKVRELIEAVSAVVRGPFTTKFPAAVDSVDPAFRGILQFNPDKCIGCGACVQVCPTNAREIVIDSEKMVLRNCHHADRCIYCGQCVRYCSTGEGIRHSTEFDTARTERSADWKTTVEKTIVYCEVCGEPFATREQLLWIGRRVGDLVNSNPTLLLVAQQELGNTTELTGRRGTFAPYRSDTMRVLCPECRRRTYLTEQWGY